MSKNFQFSIKTTLDEDGELMDGQKVETIFKGTTVALTSLLVDTCKKSEDLNAAIVSAALVRISDLDDRTRSKIALSIITSELN